MRRLLAPLTWVACLCAAGCGESAACGEGFGEEAGSCVPVCSEPCGDHAVCEGTAEGGACVCAPGYDGEPCVWSGVIRDPEFTDLEIWSDTTNGATIIPLAQGDTGMGIASFESSVVCNAGAVAQVVTMPDYDVAEPLVAQVTFRSQFVNGVVVGYGRAFRELPSAPLFPAWETSRLCLGEAAYGGEVRFQVAASERLSDCFSAPIGTIEVDRFEIAVAEPGECPAPGTAANGSADVDGGGWEFIVSLTGEGFPTAELSPAVGRGGSDGFRFSQSEGTTRAVIATTQVSVPLSSTMPSPALRFWYDLQGANGFDVGLGTAPSGRVARHPLDTLVAVDSPQIASYCLPPHTHGNVLDLFFLTQQSFESELLVDDIVLESDPSCGTDQDLLDPGFDSALGRWPGSRVEFRRDAPASQVRLIDDPARARPPGAGALEIQYTNNQAYVDVESWVWVPRPDENGRPMLVFHADAPSEPGVALFWALGTASQNGVPCLGDFCPPTPLTESLLPGGGWRRYDEICLPPDWAERWFRFRVAVRPENLGIGMPGDPLVVFDPPRSVLFDDFEVVNDPRCP